MVEVTFTYDFHTKIDEVAYTKLARKATKMMGSPHVKRTSVWESLADWALFAQQPEFQKITAEFRTYVTNLNVILWGPSPITPEPIKPQQ